MTPASLLTASSQKANHYRTAMLGLHMQTGNMPEVSRFLPASIQPPTARDSISLIKRLGKGEGATKALGVATRMLLEAGPEAPRGNDLAWESNGPLLRQLLGDARIEKLRDEYRKKKPLEGLPREARGELSTMPIAEGKAMSLPSADRQDPPPSSEDERLSRLLDKLVKEQKPRQWNHWAQASSSKLDTETLMTTVSINFEMDTPLSFDEVAQRTDPRHWSRNSAFWPKSTRVMECETPSGRSFKELSAKDDPAPIGHSWEGYFYEFCQWNWNTATISAFQNYLYVDFTVTRPLQNTREADEETGVIHFEFSLHSCRGSMLLGRVAQNGINIDSGGMTLLFARAGKSCRIRAQATKRVRFSDVLSRRTSAQGSPGSGEVLSYMAPTVVGMWMKDGMYEVYRTKNALWRTD